MLAGFSPSKIVLLASGALVLSGMLQLGTAWLQYLSEQPQVSRHSKRSYTWIGDDFPNALEIDLGPNVAMTLEDTHHYALDSADADAEWQSIYPGKNNGFIHLGPNRRFFGVSVYHQIHCLNSLRMAILGRDHASRRDVPHAQHCLNYLRQTILCSADLTLEPEVVQGSREVGEGLGVTHVCRDWSKLHSWVEENDREYQKWQNKTFRH